MKKKLITLFSVLTIVPCTFFATTSCTFEDIFDHVAEEQKKLDKDKGKNDSDEKIQEENYDFIITPQNVTGDFRTFFQSVVSSYSNILIKDGTYDIELVNGGIKPKDGCSITFEKNAKIKVVPNRLGDYRLLDLSGRKNITLRNPNLEGDKYTHLGTTGEWGIGINLINCSNIVVHSPHITKFWGDGIYLRNCTNIRIYDAVLDDNRRQAMTIISGSDIEIHNLIAKNTGGTNPGYGLNLEPNWNGESVVGLRIFNSSFINNGVGMEYQRGFSLSTHSSHIARDGEKLKESRFEIELFNPVFEGDGVLISSYTDLVKGFVKIHNPIFKKSNSIALYLTNHQSDFFSTEIINPTFLDCVQSSKERVELAPVLFYCVGETYKKNGTKNVKITDALISRTEKSKFNFLAISNVTPNTFTNDMDNVVISNVTVKGYERTFYNRGNRVLNPKFSLNFTSKSQFPSLEPNSVVYNTFTNITADYNKKAENPIFYLSDNIQVSEVEFYYRNNAANKVPLKLIFGSAKKVSKMYIDKWGGEKFSGIEIPFGAFVKLKKNKRDHWTISGASNSVRPIKT